jgi:protein-disulfide isomerase
MNLSSDAKFFLAVIVAAVLVIGGIVYYSTHQPVQKVTNLDLSQGQKVGPDSAKVKIVEFGDFECPACGDEAPIVRQVQASNSNVQLIFRNFPLITIHPNAQIAARAGQAAAIQGKFWQMYDQLYSSQSQWVNQSDPTDTLVGYAGQLGMNESEFKTDITSSQVKSVVTTDYNYALSQGFDETPTFVVNGTKYTGALTASQWATIINTALGK